MMEILERPRKVREHHPRADHNDTREVIVMAAEQSTHSLNLDEIWKPIPGYEGYYEVSDHGQVRGVTRKVLRSDGLKTTVPGRILAHSVKPRTGHRYVRLMMNGEGKVKSVHRLVLEAFVGPCPEGMVACHFDDDPDNNHVSNLRWATISDNVMDMVRNGNHNYARRTHCPRGHELAEWNVAPSPLKNGHRNCLACARASNRVYKQPELKEHFIVVSDSYYDDILANVEGAVETVPRKGRDDLAQTVIDQAEKIAKLRGMISRASCEIDALKNPGIDQ